MDGPTCSSPVPEDRAVALVERILETGRRTTPSAGRPMGHVTAAHALWICACITIGEAPTWLIYETAEEGIAWCRVPDGFSEHDLVDAEVSAGGHADPKDVLRWLQGRWPEPWGNTGSGSGAASVLDQLARKIRRQ